MNLGRALIILGTSIAVVAMLVVLCGACHAQDARLTEIPITRVGRVMHVPVRVGAHKAMFLLDTGASISVVSGKLVAFNAEQLEKAAHTQATGITGAQSMPLVKVTLTISNTTLLLHTCVIGEVQGADGILGNDVLSTFTRVTIDYKRNVLVLEE